MKMIKVEIGDIEVYAPDYAVPGTAETVEREIADAEFVNVSSSNEIYWLWRRAREGKR
jgi:hypothetical protein